MVELRVSSANGFDSENGSINVEASRVSLVPEPPVPVASRSDTEPVGEVMVV